jgi:UDP-N-acetylmuramoylalanine--D-glutamate ligase
MDVNTDDYSEKRVAVAGFGQTGKALLDFLRVQKKCKALYLFNDTLIESPEDMRAMEDYEAGGVNFIIGPERFQQLETMDLILLSPGVDGRNPRFHPLREKGVKILSEIEFASTFIKAPIIAVTGTNGKSTTVSLIHHFLIKNGTNSFLTGNIGKPLISEVVNIRDNDVVVVEVSSFQLEEIADFKPHIALILNVTPDHLNRYKDMADYFAAKLNIGRNQDTGDYMILNDDDPLLKESVAAGAAGRVWFSRLRQDVENGAFLRGNEIRINLPDVKETVSLEKNPLKGVHNLENLLAAVLAARLAGVPARGIETAMEDFKGLPHRMESVGTIGKVEFINDSKATNVDAALKSITGMDRPLVLILGGKDKGGDFTLLRDAVAEKAVHVMLIGDAARAIHRQLKGIEKECLFSYVTDFAEAVARGYEILKSEAGGGVVLLAPGCASFDMFRNFEHRGQVFKEEVLRMPADVREPEKTKGNRNG